MIDDCYLLVLRLAYLAFAFSAQRFTKSGFCLNGTMFTALGVRCRGIESRAGPVESRCFNKSKSWQMRKEKQTMTAD
ncbi:hypothetical protein DFJ73DRAFT_818072, partial [Zopfochytrium polystomum]